MKSTYFLLLCLATIFTVWSCQPKTTDTPTNVKEPVASLDMTWAKHFLDSMNTDYSAKFKAKDSVGLASFYWPDAELLFSNSEPIHGNAAIVSSFGDMVQMGIEDFTFETTDIAGDATYIIETGNYKMTDAKQAIIDRGKYLVVWQNRNGVWKLYRDTGNTSLPAK